MQHYFNIHRKLRSEAEFLDEIGTKVFRVFLLAIHSHLYPQRILTLSPSPTLSKSGMKLLVYSTYYQNNKDS
jgi:hypothetical protein